MPVIAVAVALVAVGLAAAPTHAVEQGGMAPTCALGGIEPSTSRGHPGSGGASSALRAPPSGSTARSGWSTSGHRGVRRSARVFPFLNELDRDLGARGLRIVAVGLDEVPDEARAFVERYRPTFELATDATGACPRAFGLEAMPSSYLIDHDGVVRHVFKGFRPGEAARLREAIETLLAASELRAASLQGTPPQ